MSDFYEKSRTVLWAFTPNGIILHNFATQQFCELIDERADIWAYLDGAHAPGDIAALLTSRSIDVRYEEVERVVFDTLNDLLEGGFVLPSPA